MASMKAKQVLTQSVSTTTGVSPSDFISYFDPEEMELLVTVIRDEMELAADRDDAERYEELDEYLGVALTAAEAEEERKAIEEEERDGVYYYRGCGVREVYASWWDPAGRG